jgi:hypothetical protein|tara:strand:+ start:5774 stop:6463 length:690 start_codon:yes stop_codon:yes gene_type:complete
MSIIFSLLIKRWREILILLLVGIILFLRGCGSDYGDKEIVEIDGEKFELLEQKTDTVFVEKEVKVTKYVPKYITKEVIKEVEIPVDIDSLAVIKDYYAKYVVKDTLNLTYDFPEVVTDSLGNKPSGDLGFGILTDVISQNAIESREIDWFFKIPTVYNTTIVKELPKNEFYIGLGTGIDQTNGLNNLSGNILLKNKKQNIYGLNLGLSNQLGEYKPFIGGSIYWKLGKK